MNFKILPFEMKHYESVYALWEKVFPGSNEAYSQDMIEAFLKRNEGCCFVALMDERIVGVALGGHDGWRGYLYHLGVLPEFRKYGIGRELVYKVAGAFKKNGLGKMHLFVLKHNPEALKFYQKIGLTKREDLDVCSLDWRDMSC